MTYGKYLNISVLAFAAVLGIASIAHADAYTDRMKAEQLERSRVQNQQRLIDEPEFTGSIKQPMTQGGVPTCSDDTFYWNTIYACDPAHQGLPDYRD
jgi:hypothetical protein